MEETITGLFVLIAAFSLFSLVSLTHGICRRNLEEARLIDVACLIATKIGLGERPALVHLDELSFLGTISIGKENFRYSILLITQSENFGIEENRGISVDFPVVLNKRPAKMRVRVWRA